MSCARAQGFLAEHDVTSRERADAGKEKLGAKDALRLAREADRVVVSKGKKVVTFEMKTNPPDSVLLEAMLGPTGNLRAPTVKKGKVLLVGFDPEVYGRVLG